MTNAKQTQLDNIDDIEALPEPRNRSEVNKTFSARNKDENLNLKGTVKSENSKPASVDSRKDDYYPMHG